MNDRTVLFVDDEDHLLRSLKRQLRKESYRLLTAGGGAEALALMEREPVHVVVSDQRMPEMTGTELLEEVKNRYPDTVRVVLSGYADADAILDAINKGNIFRFLTKPWNGDELKTNVRQCMVQYDLIQENRRLTSELQARNEELERVTQRLEETVDEQTRSLQFTQDAVAKLPLPVLGIGFDGTIALTNEALMDATDWPKYPTVGMHAHDVLPKEMTQWIDQWMNQSGVQQEMQVDMNNQTACWHIIPLENRAEMRGVLVTLERMLCAATR